MVEGAISVNNSQFSKINNGQSVAKYEVLNLDQSQSNIFTNLLIVGYTG